MTMRLSSKIHVSRRLLVEQIQGTDSHVIFNPLNGLIDIATMSDAASIAELQRSGVIETDAARAMANYLLERGHAYPSAEKEEDALEEQVRAARQKFAALAPNVYTVCPTLACNLGCAYCFEGDSLRDKPQGVMGQAQTQRLFAAIDLLESERAQRQRADANAKGVAPGSAKGVAKSCISLFGGEPLLPSTRTCVAEIMEFAEARGFTLAATTNGVNIVRFGDLLERHAHIFDGVQITLDGPKAMHDSRRHRLGGQGTFDEIVRGIDLLVALEIRVDLRVNLDVTNLPTLPELCAFIRDRGWSESCGVQTIVAPVTMHSPQQQQEEASGGGGSCGGASYSKAMDELDMHRALVALAQEHPIVSEVCSFAHLRHLDHLTHAIDEQAGKQAAALQRRTKADPGPRYWYCEQGTGQQFVFTPDGHIYTCTEAVGKVRHAVGRFEPDLSIWRRQSSEWLGRTILSHPKCRQCPISTLCGGGCHFGARERAAQATQTSGSGAGLLQIQLGGRLGLQKRNSDGDGDADGLADVEPYCASAEKIVREFLHTAGRALLPLAGEADATVLQQAA